MIKQPRKPNLFIIGAMKSGTTSLHEYLDTHSQIAMSTEKEPGYFVEELGLNHGEEWYLKLFKQDSCYRYLGESSTHYTKLPVYQGVAARLYQFNPAAKLIYIMRNPFDRVVSHYWHAVRDLYHGGELRPLLKAVQEDPQYLAFSNYAMQLQPYFDRFGKDGVLTLTFEALIENPQREINRIYRWLGLPSHPIGAQLTKAHNQKPKNIVGVAGIGLLNRIQYSDIWNRISPHVPSWLKDRAKRRAYRPINDQLATAEISLLRKMIAELQERQIDRLSCLLERDFPEWRAPAKSSAHFATESG